MFDKPINTDRAATEFDVDISHAKKALPPGAGHRLLLAPEKVEAAWTNVSLAGPNGTVPLSTLKPSSAPDFRSTDPDALRVKTPSRLVYDISGRGFTRLHGSAAIENREITSDINPRTRFFIFTEEPAMDRLTHVASETPVPELPPVHTSAEAVDRIFWYALGRAPAPAERDAAQTSATSAEGLADLLWAVLMKPEFQLIR